MFRLFQAAKDSSPKPATPAARREPQLPLTVTAIPARGPALQTVPVRSVPRTR
jgi:hypothetical protein